MVADYSIVGREMSLGPALVPAEVVCLTEVTADNISRHQHNRRVLDGARIRARRSDRCDEPGADAPRYLLMGQRQRR